MFMYNMHYYRIFRIVVYRNLLSKLFRFIQYNLHTILNLMHQHRNYDELLLSREQFIITNTFLSFPSESEKKQLYYLTK